MRPWRHDASNEGVIDQGLVVVVGCQRTDEVVCGCAGRENVG
jgi:hypothetical protein